MKAFVLIFSITLILCADAFEYQEEYSQEDGKWDYYYRDIEEPVGYPEPVKLINIQTHQDDKVSNVIPDEANVKPNKNEAEIPEVTTVPSKPAAKPYYEEKDAPELFRKFIKDFNKQYKNAEEFNKRYQNFVKNLKDINKLNKEKDATFDINMFADLGEGEAPFG